MLLLFLQILGMEGGGSGNYKSGSSGVGQRTQVYCSSSKLNNYVILTTKYSITKWRG